MLRRFTALIAAALLVLPGTLPASAQDGSGLKRLATGDETRGLEAVGRLQLGRSGFCTGALISDRLVVTAAHCLYDEETGALIPPGEIQFLAGLRDGRAEAYRNVRRSFPHPAYIPGPDVELDRVAVDIAILELDRPVRTGRIVPFATGRPMRRGEEVGVVSYARDRSEAPSLEQRCDVLEQERGVVMLSCDVDFGASGAPIFRWGAAGPEIVSVVSAKAEADGEKVSLASAFGRRLDEVRAEMDAAPPGVLNGGLVRMRSTGDATSGGGAKFMRP